MSQKRILCYGDSNTWGFLPGGAGRLCADQRWTGVCRRELGADYTVIECGLNGRTTIYDNPNVKFRNGADALPFALLENMPLDLAVLMLGSNDSKGINWDAEGFANEYEALVQSYIDMDSRPTVYVMRPPRLYRTVENEGDGNNEIIKGEMTEIICSVAEKLGVEVIDLYSITDGHPEWYSDGAHPNAEGNRAIAEEIAETITK